MATTTTVAANVASVAVVLTADEIAVVREAMQAARWRGVFTTDDTVVAERVLGKLTPAEVGETFGTCGTCGCQW
jgi:hypothetical protein